MKYISRERINLKQNKRIYFNDKYKNLHEEWNISKSGITEILNKYGRKLVEELVSDEPWTISEYFKDNRTTEEYIYDLLEGEMIEEFVCQWFTERGCDARRIGSDANGKVIRTGQRKITTKPDLLVDGEQIEIQISRNGRLPNYHVKEVKGKRILDGQNTLMMIVGKEYFNIDSTLLCKCKLAPNYCWGNKMCYFVRNIDVDYKKL